MAALAEAPKSTIPNSNNPTFFIALPPSASHQNAPSVGYGAVKGPVK